MRRTLLLLTAMFLLPATAHAATTVPIGGDTFVRSDQPTTNFGAVNPLHVDGQVVGDPANPERQSYLYFPGVPADVTSAKLRLHIPFPTAEGFQVRSISCDGWTAAAVTYNTKPALGAVLANVPPATANAYNDITLPALPAGSNCLALTKTGNNWMTVSSKESANPPLLVVETAPPPPPPSPQCSDGVDNSDPEDTLADFPNDPGCSSATDDDETDSPPPPPPPPPTTVDDCSGGAVVNATPSTLASAVASSSRVIVNAAPGNYGGYSRWPSSTQSCVKIKCTVSAKTGNTENSGGCRATGQWGGFGNIRNFTVEGFHFVTSDDYGLQFYNESPIITGMKVRVADNVFHGNMYHDIATKSGNGTYTEVINNLFISCMRHCWEIGQNGNIRTRPSTAEHNVFRGNTVSSRINAVTNRATVRTDVENNTFGSVSGWAVVNETYWALYPFGSSGDNGALYVPGTDSLDDPYRPLRTNITGNSFSSGNRMTFQGRGVIDDVVKVQGNSGTPSCSRVNMPSGTASAHINEQTTGPPARDPASDIPC